MQHPRQVVLPRDGGDDVEEDLRIGRVFAQIDFRIPHLFIDKQREGIDAGDGHVQDAERGRCCAERPSHPGKFLWAACGPDLHCPHQNLSRWARIPARRLSSSPAGGFGMPAYVLATSCRPTAWYLRHSKSVIPKAAA